MKRSYRVCGILLVFGISLACADDKEKVLGPEWTRDGDYFTRKVEIKAARPAEQKATATDYRIDLDHFRLQIAQEDDGTSCYASILLGDHRSTKMNVLRDKKGEIYQYEMGSNLVTYYDFDRDGILDGYSDARGKNRKLMILVRQAYMQIRDSKNGFKFAPQEKGPAPQTAFVGDTRYRFEDGKWTEE